MKKVLCILLATLLILPFASCSTYSMTFVSSFSGAQQEAIDAYCGYIKSLATGNFHDTYQYESNYLWPSLDKDLYLSVRNRHKEFQSLVSRATFNFSQSAHQKEWGVFGQKYKDAYILSFDVKYPEELSVEEKAASELIGAGPFVTVAVRIDDSWKFLPAFGPELIDIKNAELAYNKYLKAIIDKNFDDIWQLTSTAMKGNATKEQLKDDWDMLGIDEIVDFLKGINLHAVSGRVEFGPNMLGNNYVFCVTFNIFLDTEKLDYKSDNDQIKLVIDDWTSGRNSTVSLVFEEDWKVIPENPLF